jgi:hypothetical protein
MTSDGQRRVNLLHPGRELRHLVGLILLERGDGPEVRPYPAAVEPVVDYAELVEAAELVEPKRWFSGKVEESRRWRPHLEYLALVLAEVTVEVASTHSPQLGRRQQGKEPVSGRVLHGQDVLGVAGLRGPEGPVQEQDRRTPIGSLDCFGDPLPLFVLFGKA